MKTTSQKHHHLIAQLAISGLNHSALSPEERADFYEELSALLPPPTAEAARYAATCLRECQRAQREIVTALQAGNPLD
jgi:uncharacterized protein (DUF2336 family)